MSCQSLNAQEQYQFEDILIAVAEIIATKTNCICAITNMLDGCEYTIERAVVSRKNVDKNYDKDMANIKKKYYRLMSNYEGRSGNELPLIEVFHVKQQTY